MILRMPYLLTSTNAASGSSPTSWVKMDETESVLSAHSDFSNVNNRATATAGNLSTLRANGQRSRNMQSPSLGKFNGGMESSPASKYSNYVNAGLAANSFNTLHGPGASSNNGLSNGIGMSNHHTVPNFALDVSTPPPMLMSPTSVFSNYSLNRNHQLPNGGGNHANLSLAPRTGR